jgi:hypothetical protein
MARNHSQCRSTRSSNYLHDECWVSCFSQKTRRRLGQSLCNSVECESLAESRVVVSENVTPGHHPTMAIAFIFRLSSPSSENMPPRRPAATTTTERRKRRNRNMNRLAASWTMLLMVLLPTDRGAAFVVIPHHPQTLAARSTRSLSFSRNSSSRIEGNQREPTKQDLAVMDEMIGKLLGAEPYELPGAVKNAIRVIRSPRFFLRIAELADASSDQGLKTRYGNLAQNLVATLDAVMSLAQEQMDDLTARIERIVQAAAEPDSGEFLVPLTPERLAAMRTAFAAYDDHSTSTESKSAAAAADEGFLSTIDAWMNKAHLDGMDGMVVILQTLLQIYAARRLSQQIKEPSPLLVTLLQQSPTGWDATLRSSGGASSSTNSSSVVREIQRHMEAIILSLETGSMAQKVQAEFLREMVRVAESVAA